MNAFKFWDVNGHYIVAIPYKDRWLVIEEGWPDQVIQYVYIPYLKKRIQFIERGVRIIYSSKRRFIRDRSLKYIPSKFVMGGTI
jgi:hypothetical protein